MMSTRGIRALLASAAAGPARRSRSPPRSRSGSASRCWIDDRTSITVDVGVASRSICSRRSGCTSSRSCPAFYVLRVLSLTDLSLAAAGRAGDAALARDRRRRDRARAAVVDHQTRQGLDRRARRRLRLDLRQAARRRAALRRRAREGRGRRQPPARHVRREADGRPQADDGKALSAAIERHASAGAGTDAQAAMQLAYGLYPEATCRAW